MMTDYCWAWKEKKTETILDNLAKEILAKNV